MMMAYVRLRERGSANANDSSSAPGNQAG